MGKLLQKKNVRQHYGSTTAINFNEKEIKILQLLAQDKTTEEMAKLFAESMTPKIKIKDLRRLKEREIKKAEYDEEDNKRMESFEEE